MKLVSFTLEKYRSIVRAHRIYTDKATILIGPNNEGKSNILRGLVAAMNTLTRGGEVLAQKHRQLVRFAHHRYYDWKLDFPIRLQSEQPDGQSTVLLEFELTEAEIEMFRKEIGSNLNGTLPLSISMGGNTTNVRVVKQGKGAKALTAKSARIATFIAKRLDFEHIPAVRTAESARRIVDMMVDRELAVLEENPKYLRTLSQIGAIQQPLLDTLAASIRDTLRKFLPAVRDVKLQISEENRLRAVRRACEIIVDDGTPTLLEYKGDGMQSLAALGIMRYASERRGAAKNLVIAIEEPESHLHPRAIHELKAVLDELSDKHQVVLTTHCPLFIDRGRVDHNVVVNRSRARPARSIQEIRDILGVRASDNLRHAEIVLVVEGEEDRIALGALLRHNSENLRSALDNGTLAIESLTGGTNLAYKLSSLREALCSYHCFLDNDDCGRRAFDKARIEGLVRDADCNFTTCPGMVNSEIEDLYDVSAYKGSVENYYRISLNTPKFRTSRKWTERMREVFRQHGRAWDDRVQQELKQRMVEAITENLDSALNRHKREAFDALVQTLEGRILERDRNRNQ